MSAQAENGENLIVGVAAICLFNGIFSPFVGLFYVTTLIWLPNLFPGVTEMLILPELKFYFSSLIVATCTLLFGGVPAALYERFIGAGGQSVMSMTIWMIGCGLLAVPAFQQLGIGK